MHETNFLIDVLILLAAAVVVVACFRRLNLSPVLGYLAAGTLIGPYGFGIITHLESASSIAEIGVVFLLFMIGLELSFERLRDMRRMVFGIGSLQMLFTGLMLMILVMMLWQKLWAVSLVIGFALALSSTAIVLQVVQERGEQSSQIGRLSLAILLLQDLAVVPLLVLIPLLGNSESTNLGIMMGSAVLKAVVVMVLIILLGRVLLRPVFRLIAQTDSPELFVAATLFIVLGTSYATYSMGLSMALGAFLAGLLVAETEFEHQVEADVLPFKGLFLGLFFMTVGMQLDVALLHDNFTDILALTLGLLTIKALVLAAVCRLCGIRWLMALQTGVLLSQGSEFAFILFGLAAENKLLHHALAQHMMVVVTLSMALTPLLTAFSSRLVRWYEQRRAPVASDILRDTSDLEHHVILAGFGHVGQAMSQMLAMERLSFVAVDTDAKTVSEGRKQHLPVYYGDARRADVLDAVGIHRASLLAFTYTGGQELVRAIAAVRRQYPDLVIAARAKDNTAVEKLKRAGVTIVVPEYLETSLQLGQAVLRARGINEIEARRIAQTIRYRVTTQGKAPTETPL